MIGDEIGLEPSVLIRVAGERGHDDLAFADGIGADAALVSRHAIERGHAIGDRATVVPFFHAEMRGPGFVLAIVLVVLLRDAGGGDGFPGVPGLDRQRRLAALAVLERIQLGGQLQDALVHGVVGEADGVSPRDFGNLRPVLALGRCALGGSAVCWGGEKGHGDEYG